MGMDKITIKIEESFELELYDFEEQNLRFSENDALLKAKAYLSLLIERIVNGYCYEEPELGEFVRVTYQNGVSSPERERRIDMECAKYGRWIERDPFIDYHVLALETIIKDCQKSKKGLVSKA